MNKQFYIFQNMQMKNLIIFLVVSAFAAQALLLIIIYGHDIPLSDDADQIFLGYLIANNYEITTNDFIDIHNGHIPLFIRLLSVPLLLTFSFTSMPIFYLQWIFLCIIITVTYYLLKRTNEKATWLIIPISMLVFNPLQEYPLTWTLGGLQQTLPLLSYVLIIFLLNTSKLTFPKISLALFFASVAMFSNEAGLFFWPIMILSFLRQKKRKKWVITWILGCSFLTLLFLSQTIGSDCKFGGGCEENIIVNSFTDLIDNEKIYAFFLSLGSIAFRLKFNEMYIIVGTIIIISFLMGLLYSLINRKKLSSVIPWCEYGLVGLIYISLLAIGRFHAWNGEGVNIDTYYIPLTTLIPIGLIVLTNEIFTYWKNKILKNKKKLLTVVFVIFISVLILMLIPSHVIGWKLADASASWKNSEFSGCLLLPAKTLHYDSFEYCSEYFLPKYLQTFNDRQEFAPELWNYFLKNGYNVFTNDEFNKINYEERSEFIKKWDDIKNITKFHGTIENINSQDITNNKIFELDNFQVVIQGSIKNISFDQINYLYLFLNNQPFAKIVDFDYSQKSHITWQTVFLSGYIPDGCHEFSLGFMHKDSKFVSFDKIQFCKIEQFQ